jgi:hypothetical protein
MSMHIAKQTKKHKNDIGMTVALNIQGGREVGVPPFIFDTIAVMVE